MSRPRLSLRDDTHATSTFSPFAGERCPSRQRGADEGNSLASRPANSGEGGPPKAVGGARVDDCLKKAKVSSLTPPPPRYARSPSPAARGRRESALRAFDGASRGRMKLS